MFWIYGDFDHLIINRRIIKISSQQKEHKYGSHDIVAYNRQHYYSSKDNNKKKIPHLTSFKLFSIINKNIHTPQKNI